MTDQEQSLLQAKLNRIEQAMKSRKRTPSPGRTAEIVRLTIWPESARGVPNSALRGALFAAIQGKDRQYMKREELAAPAGITIRFTGMQLDQTDLDVWEQCLHLAHYHPLGTRCDFTAHSFLKALGRKTGNSEYEWLKDVFARLAGAVVEITHDNKTYFGALIEGGRRDEISDLYRVEINPTLATLYSAGWTATDWGQRQALRGKPLALWLHGFYSTHADPHPMKVETLHKFCGSKNKCLRGYKRDLKRAYADLQAVGAVNSYSFNGDLVSVDRLRSRSQKRHLSRKK